MDGDDEQRARQSGTVWALRLWWLLASTLGAILSLALNLSIHEVGKSDIALAIGFLVGSAVIAGIVGVMQWVVLWSYLPDGTGSEWTRVTGSGIVAAFLLSIVGGLMVLLPVMTFGAIASFSSSARNSDSTGTVVMAIAVIAVMLGVVGASIVGAVQGEMLSRYIERTAWRTWRRTGAVVSAVIFLLCIILIFVIPVGAWLTNWLGIAVSAAVLTGIALVGLLRSPQ